MKNYSLFLLFTVILTGCGQFGPLYLPNGPAPIHVDKPKEEKPKLEQPKAEPKTPSKTEPEKTK